MNPGNNVQIGQSLMAVRSLTIWVDANFKETQLDWLRIGQPADLDVDMYGSRYVFKGRVSGFTMGTGSTLALLAGGKRHGQFRESRAAAARANRRSSSPTRSIIRCFTDCPVTPYVYIHEKTDRTRRRRFPPTLLHVASRHETRRAQRIRPDGAPTISATPSPSPAPPAGNLPPTTTPAPLSPSMSPPTKP